jgi:hypothetical protein
MIIDIPNSVGWQQLNKSNRLGSIDETFNVDLTTRPGYVALPNRVQETENDTDLTAFGVLSNIVYFDGAYFGTSVGQDSGTYDGDARLFRGGDSVDNSFAEPSWTGLTEDKLAGLVAYKSDLYYLADSIFSISSKTDVSFTEESTANARGGLTTVYNGRVYFLDQTRIRSFVDPTTPATTGSYTFATVGEYDVSCMDSDANGVWIGSISNEGGDAKVYLWDGITESVADAEYVIPDPQVMAIHIYNGRPYIVTSKGLLMAFNGAYFEEIARFPFFGIPLFGRNFETVDISSSNGGRWIHQHGIAVVDNKLHFLVAPNSQSVAGDEIYGEYKKLAGIWCYDESVGLYHRYAISSNTTDNEPALNGQLKHVGALVPAGDISGLADTEIGKFLCSASYYTENSITTEAYGSFALMSAPNTDRMNIGYLTTSRIYGEQITEQWKSVMVGFEDLDSSDSIIVKYRNKELDAIETGITWVDTTQFTTTDTDWATIKTNFDADTNYEVRILYGDGAGVLSQITAITEAGGTYTVTLSETHNGVTATNTAKARIENWTVADTITSADNNANNLKEIPVNRQGQWIQYKLVLVGLENGSTTINNPIINRLISISEPLTKFK